ncbi:MAG: hypothetical protein ABI878_11500 [Acidobacteriota bacterium]
MRISFFSLTAILLSLTFGVGAQEASRGAIDRSKPTIYIESIGKSNARTDLKSSEESYYWLRLHNNSRWGIRLDMSGGYDEKLGDVGLYYDVVDKNENVTSRFQCHVCSTNILKSGKAVIFGIPRDQLANGFSIRVNFSFDWESDTKVASGLEPEHYVFFRSEDLPRK